MPMRRTTAITARLLFSFVWLSWCALSLPVRAQDTSAGPTEILDWGRPSWHAAPVDLSFLNAPEKPAGKHGFLRAVKDKLVFEDGTPARFWGTNLTASALFGMTSREDVRLQARRLSQLGFNLVRLHHHDSFWLSPNIFGDAKTPDTKSLSEPMLERLDWWIKCLRDEGIYIWLDLDVQRRFKRGDGIDGFDEISSGKSVADPKGFNYFNASIQEAMRRFNEAYVNHVNSFTGLSYKNDPAIAIMMLTNENDLTHHYGSRLLPNKNVPQHTALYMEQAEAFAAKNGLPKDKVWRAWESGPSKLFLNEVEYRFNVKMIEHLRAQGVKVPIATTNVWWTPLSSLPALTAGDLIDVHTYGSAGQLNRNPMSAVTLEHYAAVAHVADRPLTISEWNVGSFPTSDRHAMPLFIASTAAKQGVSAPIQFAYSERPVVGEGIPSNWQSFNDPSFLGTLPAAALLYRRQDVQEAGTVYVFAPTDAQLFGQDITPEKSVALRTAAEKGKLMIALPQIKELPWLEPSRIPDGAKVITDPAKPLIDATAVESQSDNGELRRNWEQGIFTIDTPRTQAAMGQIGGKSISLRDVDIEVSTVSATVSVQSLGDKSIRDADAILISLGAKSLPKTAKETPFYSELVIGRLAIQARKGLKLYPRRGTTTKDALEVPYENGRYLITLDRKLASYWLVLK